MKYNPSYKCVQYNLTDFDINDLMRDAFYKFQEEYISPNGETVSFYLLVDLIYYDQLFTIDYGTVVLNEFWCEGGARGYYVVSIPHEARFIPRAPTPYPSKAWDIDGSFRLHDSSSYPTYLTEQLKEANINPKDIYSDGDKIQFRYYKIKTRRIYMSN